MCQAMMRAVVSKQTTEAKHGRLPDRGSLSKSGTARIGLLLVISPGSDPDLALSPSSPTPVPDTRCTIDSPSVTPLTPILLPRRTIRVMEDTTALPHQLTEARGILDMLPRLLLREDHHPVRIRTFGIGFRRWIRIGQDLSP